MEALYLDIKNRICVGVNAVMSLYEVGKLLLLALLYVDKAAEHVLIVGKLSKLAEPVKVIYPAIVTQQLGYKGRQLSVAEGYPAALSDAVCLVAELLGRKAEPVRQHGVLEYLGVYLRNAVDMAGSITRHIRHVDKAALDYLYAVGLVLLYASCVHIRDKGFIETDPHITAMIPLKAWNGEVTGILCVQRQMDVLVKERNSYIIRLGLILGGMILLVIAGQSVFLNHTLLKPLYTITKEAKRFSEENTVRTEKLQNAVKNRDEIGLLAESIDSMEEQIGKYVEDLTKITAEKERISTELSLAKKIQAALLPSIFPPFPDRKEFDLYASMEPAREVGGDFYDFFLIDDDHLCLVMADVSGKGIPAALFMMICKTMLQSCAMLGQSSAEILNKVNQGICSSNGEEMFVTVWVGILEISTGKLKAANAGHEYPAVKKPDGRFELLKDPHGFVVGGLPDEIYEEYTLQLEPGSALFLYTDGIPEAMTKDRQMFGTERMLEALNAQPEADPETVLKNVRGAAAEFAGGAEQSDDITMLALNYFGPQNK